MADTTTAMEAMGDLHSAFKTVTEMVEYFEDMDSEASYDRLQYVQMWLRRYLASEGQDVDRLEAEALAPDFSPFHPDSSFDIGGGEEEEE